MLCIASLGITTTLFQRVCEVSCRVTDSPIAKGYYTGTHAGTWWRCSHLLGSDTTQMKGHSKLRIAVRATSNLVETKYFRTTT